MSSDQRPEDSRPEKVHPIRPRSARDVDLTPAQRAEAERRLRQHESDPKEYSTWEEIERRLEDEL